MTAVDFSFARPGAQALKDAGVVAAGRYLTGPGKAVDGPELQSYLNAGIVVWFVYEVGAADDQGGFSGGVQSATAANGALQLLGLPVDCPVYFAVDHDLPDPQVALPYFEGIASVRPATTNGDYGEGALCQLLEDQGLTKYHWQSASTSFPGNSATLPITHIQQGLGGPLPDTGLDILCKPDFGQWPRPISPPTTEDPEMIAANTDPDGAQRHLYLAESATGPVVHYWQATSGPDVSWHVEKLPAVPA